MFQINDKVICIDAVSPHVIPLKINEVYTIDYISEPFCYVKELPGHGFRITRFELTELVDDYKDITRRSLWEQVKSWWLS